VTDAVVIGAGPNGLVAANRLADAGWSVIVLEASGSPGGAVKTAELTLPGFRHDLFSAFYPLAAASPILRGFDLEDYGLRWRRSPVVLAHPLRDGRCASLSTEVDGTAASLDAFSSGSGDAWRSMYEAWLAISEPVLDGLFQPFPPVKAGVGLIGRLGPLGALRFARHAMLPLRRMVEELSIGEGGALLLGGNGLHTDLCPEAAGSGMFGWLMSCLGQQFGFPAPEGGAGCLTDALVRRLESLGGTVRCEMAVTEVIIRQGRAVGVRTASGDAFDATRAVVADVSAPVLYRDLVGEKHLPTSVVSDLRTFQWDMSTLKVDWALEGPIPWSAPDARRAGTVHVADDFDNFTEFAAEIAMGRLARRPFLLVGQQSPVDPTRSPPGTETAWAYTHVPRHIRSDAAGELPTHGSESWVHGFVDRMEARVEALAPGFTSFIRARHVFTPEKLEREDPNLFGGAINGGTSQIHQQLIFRPIPGWGRAETPITALYLASASAHPGGGVHGAPGANAAQAALLPIADLRSRIFGRGIGRSASDRVEKAKPFSAPHEELVAPPPK
jgi:phytoene dehydrogenase-like protein